VARRASLAALSVPAAVAVAVTLATTTTTAGDTGGDGGGEVTGTGRPCALPANTGKGAHDTGRGAARALAGDTGRGAKDTGRGATRALAGDTGGGGSAPAAGGVIMFLRQNEVIDFRHVGPPHEYHPRANVAFTLSHLAAFNYNDPWFPSPHFSR